jgi:hypothetical protein
MQAGTDSKGHALANGEDGQVTDVITMGKAAAYPANLPFAQYPGSKVTLSIVTPGTPNKSVNLETADHPDKAVAYYKNWFTKAGK